MTWLLCGRLSQDWILRGQDPEKAGEYDGTGKHGQCDKAQMHKQPGDFIMGFKTPDHSALKSFEMYE